FRRRAVWVLAYRSRRGCGRGAAGVCHKLSRKVSPAGRVALQLNLTIRSGPGWVSFCARFSTDVKKKMPIKNLLSASLIVAASLAPMTASAQQNSTAAEPEIRIGNLMPYTGALAAFATIGRVQAAYFDMINERGGVGGRKIKFISVDD